MKKIFTPLKIGNMEVPNRTFMAPISLGFETPDGLINKKHEAYWLARAKGGVGCIITNVLSVDPNVPYLGNTLCLRDETSIEKYKSFTDKIHEAGSKIIPQITHPGPESVSAFFGVTPVASSNYVNSMGQKVRALTLDEIPEIISKYANTSLMAKQAGFDGIELHCAHAYMLLGSFLSPLRNKRTDRYGGSLQNRARLLFEVIDAIKEKCGKDFPILLRISGSEKDPEGNTVEDICSLVDELIEHGIDAFEISGGTQYENPNMIIPGHSEKQATNLEQAKIIKKISRVPVIMVGKINEPKRAIQFVEQGDVDGVVLGRALICDPEFVNKAKAERFDEIAPCAACVIGCGGEQSKRRPGSCVINPFVGRESELIIKPKTSNQTFAIIGGGIGGMATARMLALRGYDVTIYEKENILGGQMNIACVPPYKQELSKWIVYLNNELTRLNVKVIQKEITPETLNELHEDIIICATGSKPIIPEIKGIGTNPVTAHDIFSGKINLLGGNILVVGGGMVGMEVCEYLDAHKLGNLRITLVEMDEQIGKDMPASNFKPMMKRLIDQNVNIMTNTKLVSINLPNVVVEKQNQKVNLYGFSHIIFACGSKSDDTLYKLLKEAQKKVYCIGDAIEPRQALEAVREGTELALIL